MRLSNLLAIAMVALLVGGLLLGFGRGGTRIGPFEGDPLNPDVYRAQIVTVDAIVFEDGTLGEAEREELGNTLLVMGRFAETDTTNTIATTLGQNIRTLAALAKKTRVGTPMLNSRLRREWLRIRSGLFDDAWWFRRSSADPVEPAVPGPPPPSPLRPATPEERLGLEQTLFSLDLLLERARRDLPNSYDSEQHKILMVDAQRELVLDSVRLGPVPPLYDIDGFYRESYNFANEAIRNLRMLTTLGVGAPQSSREYLINKAAEHVARGKDALREMR